MSQKKVFAFGGLWNKKNFDEKILFGNTPNLINAGIRKMLVKDMLGNKSSTFHSGT